MPQTVTHLAAQLVKTHTSLPFEQVVSRLDKETNKERNLDIAPRIKAAKDQAELVSLINKSIGECGFLYFSETSYHHLEKAGTQPKLLAYVIGNPLIAKSILQSNPFANLHIPLRLTITEIPGRKGTIVAYYLPSSVMIRPGEKIDMTLIKLLDDQLNKLVSRITETKDKARL